MKIELFGKTGCALCDAAKSKLVRLEAAFEFVDLEHPPENWRATSLAAAMAFYQERETLPILALDGECLTYPEAMRRLNGNG